MKKFLFLLMATVSMLKVNAQDSTLPMLEEGRIWNKLSLHPAPIEECEYKDIYGNPRAGIYYQYVIEGDSVIKGQTYKKLNCKEMPDQYFPICMRQEGSRIYMYDFLGDEKETLIYDFSLKERDTVTISEENRLVVDKVDTVKVDGICRRRLTMNWILATGGIEREYFVDIWVEGIGGVVSSPGFYHTWLSTGSSGMTISCIQDGRMLFTEEDFYAPAWKGETVSVENIRNSSTVTQSSVFYDLQGRRHSGNPTKGVYIQNGRMWLTK